MPKSSTGRSPRKSRQIQTPPIGTAQRCARWDELDSQERMSVVCNLFVTGRKFADIAGHINKQYQTKVSRESIYPIVLQAIKNKWIRYAPPQNMMMEGQIKSRYDWLMGAKITHTSRFDDVAYHAAEMLVDLLKQMHHQGKTEAHIGFAGGHAIRKVAGLFAELITHSEDHIPQKLTLHALVAGFDVFDPTTDPNTFFTLFQSDKSSGIEFGFVGLHTPPLVKTADYHDLIKVQGIKESYGEADKVDIIVTSASNWSDDHCLLKQYMMKSPHCQRILDENLCVGDMLWRPIGKTSPINALTEIRAMTLFELNQIPALIRKGKHVLLVLGPCVYCEQPKSEILEAILGQREKLITHLVADSRSVRGMLKAQPGT